MPRAMKKSDQLPRRRPPLTTRTRRGLYDLLALLRGDYALTLEMIRTRARDRGAEHVHELDAALDWIDDMRRFHAAKGKMRRKILSADLSKRPRQPLPPPPSAGI